MSARNCFAWSDSSELLHIPHGHTKCEVLSTKKMLRQIEPAKHCAKGPVVSVCTTVIGLSSVFPSALSAAAASPLVHPVLNSNREPCLYQTMYSGHFPQEGFGQVACREMQLVDG